MVDFSKKIYVIDGAMGTEIQNKSLPDSDFVYEDIFCDGFNDILSLTNPKIIQSIHLDYIEAGADIIGTNTFNANYISARDYGLTNETIDLLNFKAAKLASVIAKKHGAIVAGVLGPTSKTLSISPDVLDPSTRDISYAELFEAYRESTKNLLAGGADIILIETIFDTLNAKAAIEAVRTFGAHVPIMISGTIVDRSGRTLSGQTVEAFWNSVKHADPIAVGLNCALGIKEMAPYIERLSDICSCAISAYPNAGLPNELGEYDQTPTEMAALLRPLIKNKNLNIVGGCCGTRPSHIRKISKLVKKATPRVTSPHIDKTLILSGLEEFDLSEKNFINIGERTNVMGSSRFKKCVFEKRYDDALEIARSQIENGAQIIDINFDDGLLDAEEEMVHFLKLIAGEPDIARVPIMVDSSKWSVLSKSMRWLQGRGIVNSISLKDGEDEFLKKAKEIVSCGHAFVVMAFDEAGQADTLEKKKNICTRAYWLLVENGIMPTDIIFDPNVFAIATGMKEHNNYAVDFIEATRYIKKKLPLAKVSGGLSNLSFSFRGNNRIREMMHSVFLYHAIQAGLDMAIVNAGQLTVYDSIDPKKRDIVERAILNRSDDASEALLALAQSTSGKKSKSNTKNIAWRKLTVDERISYALVNGIDKYIVDDVKNCFEQSGLTALQIVEGPLMIGMDTVGDLFGSGKMFLPQVVKSARVMKKAVAWLEPYMDKDAPGAMKGKILMATVKGDVHDIGKNIVSVVLQCNGYSIIDLGVMVPKEKIIEEAKKHKVSAIGLSGLITPSLDEMVKVAAALKESGLDVPLLVGGATTSKIHTATRISVAYDRTVHVKNASIAVGTCARVLKSKDIFDSINSSYEDIRNSRSKRKRSFCSIKNARANRFKLSTPAVKPQILGCERGVVDIANIRPYIDWAPFAMTWGMKPKQMSTTQTGKDLIKDANQMIDLMESDASFKLKFAFSIDECKKNFEDVTVENKTNQKVTFNFLRQPQQKSRLPNMCLSDFLHENDWLGTFAVWVEGIDQRADVLRQANDDYRSIMIQALGDRFAEATAEWLHEKMRLTQWASSSDEDLSTVQLISEEYDGIRPAPGYPACPDHTQKIKIINWLGIQEDIGITEGLTMTPKSAICGWYFASQESKYFGINNLPSEYLKDLEKRNKLFVKHKNHLN
jgi:5-methyltetrahydrofolate--homocysteine methyltransferase